MKETPFGEFLRGKDEKIAAAVLVIWHDVEWSVRRGEKIESREERADYARLAGT